MAAIGGSAVDALNQRVEHACVLFGLLDKPAESPVRLPAPRIFGEPFLHLKRLSSFLNEGSEHGCEQTLPGHKGV